MGWLARPFRRRPEPVAGPDPAITWRTPWYAIADQEARAVFEGQLRREVGRRHVLYGRAARAIGRVDGRDDTLFLLADGSVAEVHLTWRKGAEPDPAWPRTALFPTADAWCHESLAAWAEEWDVPD